MVIELDEQKMDKAMYTIEERTRFMISVQVSTLLAVLTIIGFHSKFGFHNGFQVSTSIPVLPCITTTILVGICIFYQVQRMTLNDLRTKLICTYYKDGKIVMED